MDHGLKGKKVKHIRTGFIREIFILEDNETPSIVALEGKFDPINHIFLETYLSTKQFYQFIN